MIYPLWNIFFVIRIVGNDFLFIFRVFYNRNKHVRCSVILEVHFFIYFFFTTTSHFFIEIAKPTFFTHNKFSSKPFIFPLFQTNFNPNPKPLLVLSIFFSTFKHIFLYYFQYKFSTFLFQYILLQSAISDTILYFHFFRNIWKIRF